VEGLLEGGGTLNVVKVVSPFLTLGVYSVLKSWVDNAAYRQNVITRSSAVAETTRRFVSLNILLSHSRSFEMTLLSRECVSPYWYFIETMYVIPFMRYSASKNGITLKTGGRSRSRSLKMAQLDRSCTTFYWSATVSIAVCCTIFNLMLNKCDLEKVTEGHSNWYHSKAWVPSIVTIALPLNVYEIFSIKV